MADLLICRGTTVDRRVPLRAGGAPLRVGRSPQNDIELPDDGKAVSRSHAELRFEKGQFVLVDLESENGLWKNGERMARVSLTPTDAVILGPYRLLLDLSDEESQTVFSPLPVAPTDEPVARESVVRVASGRARQIVGGIPPQLKTRTAGVTVALVVGAITVAGIAWPRGDRAEPPGPPVDPPSVARPPDPGVTSQAAESVARARQLMEAGDLSAASAELSRALKSEPSHAGALALNNVLNERLQRRLPQPVTGQRPEAGVATASARTSPPAATVATKPALEPLPAFQVATRPSEPERDYRARVLELHGRYTAAVAQLDRGDSAAAIAVLQDLLANEPRQPDVESALARAREHRRTALRQQAQETFEAAAKLEAAGNLRAAEQRYAEAQAIEGAPAGIDATIARIRTRRVELGNAALAEARQFHSMQRLNDAIAAYQRATELLPDGHPNHTVASDLLRTVRGDRR
jgi:tetratricopeptide (TPR) repeat protein